MLIQSNYFFLLGASDPEMNRIAELMKLLGIDHANAMGDGRPVHAGNAYRAQMPATPWQNHHTLVFVECDIPGITPDIRIDHHNPGDPGYALPAQEYFRASSLGQFFTLMQLTPSHKDHVLAAMDHCYSDAVRGLCPGVSRDEVRTMRLGHLYKQLRQMLGDYAQLLAEAPRITIGSQEVALFPEDLGVGYSFHYLVAQFVAVDTETPVLLLSRQETDGLLRLHLCGAELTKETIRTFMDEWAPKHDLVDIYGVEVRKYAGGYLQGSFNLEYFLGV